MKDIKKILKERRKVLGLTQQDLARISKRQQSFFSKLEQGKRKISVDDFDLLEKVYKIKINLDICEVKDE